MKYAVELYGADAKTVNEMAKAMARVGKTTHDEKYYCARFLLTLEQYDNIITDQRFAMCLNWHIDANLYMKGKPAAVGLLVDVVSDTEAPLAQRLRAAELILSRTLPPVTSKDDAPERDLDELPVEDLHAIVESLQDKIAERAESVSVPKQIEGKATRIENMFD